MRLTSFTDYGLRMLMRMASAPQRPFSTAELADEFGLRFVLCRGGALESASAHPGFSKTALQPETLDQMVADIERLKSRYHQDTPDALRRVVVAPTTPTFSLPPTLLRELAHTARGLGLRLHTHLSETQNYVNFCREKYNCLPVEFVAENEWLGPDVWFAHMVHLQPSEIRLLAQTGSATAVAATTIEHTISAISSGRCGR